MDFETPTLADITDREWVDGYIVSVTNDIETEDFRGMRCFLARLIAWFKEVLGHTDTEVDWMGVQESVQSSEGLE